MISPNKLQGVLLGLSNTAGVLAGVFGTAATGYILQKGNKTQKSQKWFPVMHKKLHMKNKKLHSKAHDIDI
jgi:hypothetical protein